MHIPRSVRLAVLVLLAAGSVYGLWHIAYATLFALLRAAPLWLLLLGVVCNFINLCGKASSWFFLLPPTLRPRYVRLIRYSIASTAFSVVAPLRAGEGLRIYLLHAREGVPVSLGVGVALSEKLLNVLGLVLLVLPLPFLQPGLPPWLMGASMACAAGVLALGCAIYFAPKLLPRGRYLRLHTLCGVLMARRAALLPALLCLLLGWLGDCTLAALMLRACGLHLPLLVVPFILFVINVAIVVPSTPAQVGALELAAVGALQLLAVPRTEALAFALLYHAVQILPLLLVVLLEARLLRDAARRMAR